MTETRKRGLEWGALVALFLGVASGLVWVGRLDGRLQSVEKSVGDAPVVDEDAVTETLLARIRSDPRFQPAADAGEFAELTGRVAELEGAVAALPTESGPQGPDPAAVRALEGRIGDVEAEVRERATDVEALTARVDALASQAESLAAVPVEAAAVDDEVTLDRVSLYVVGSSGGSAYGQIGSIENSLPTWDLFSGVHFAGSKEHDPDFLEPALSEGRRSELRYIDSPAGREAAQLFRETLEGKHGAAPGSLSAPLATWTLPHLNPVSEVDWYFTDNLPADRIRLVWVLRMGS